MFYITDDGVSLATVIDFDIVVSEFKFESVYFVHFQSNTLRKYMNPLVPPAMI